MMAAGKLALPPFSLALSPTHTAHVSRPTPFSPSRSLSPLSPLARSLSLTLSLTFSCHTGELACICSHEASARFSKCTIGGIGGESNGLGQGSGRSERGGWSGVRGVRGVRGRGGARSGGREWGRGIAASGIYVMNLARVLHPSVSTPPSCLPFRVCVYVCVCVCVCVCVKSARVRAHSLSLPHLTSPLLGPVLCVFLSRSLAHTRTFEGTSRPVP